VWRLAVGLLFTSLLLCPPASADSGACRAARAVLVHPEVRGVYRDAVRQIAAGLERGGVSDLAVCSLSGYRGIDGAGGDAVVFAVGDRVAAEVAEAAASAVLGLLVTGLQRSLRWGVSLFADPGAVITRIRALKPDVSALHLVHLAQAPASAISRARSAARRAGLAWEATPVSSVRDAARAIERLKSAGAAGTAVWFHNGVLGLNPDVLIPPLVRISWNRGVFVVADDAAYVERGVLMSVSPDLQELGAMAARAAERGSEGLHDTAAVQWGVNRRTAGALGVEGRVRRGPAPDFVYE
jgi:putative ABC transport system substrate-binding protein